MTATAPSHRPATPALLNVLRWSALLTALGAVLQTVLGLMVAFGNHDLLETHEPVAYATFLLSIVAAVAGFLWGRRAGNTGLGMHALSIAILAVVQIGLGSMGLEEIHIGVGVLFLVAAVALVTLAFRKPGTARTSADPTR